MPQKGNLARSQPRYLQLREHLRAEIARGNYPSGSCIPSESVLAQTYKLHRLSVRSAISALLREGILKSVQGKGVYVTGCKLTRDLDCLGGFKQTMLAHNKQPSTRILIKTLRPAGKKYGSILLMDPEAELYYIRRVCYCDGAPVSLEDIYIPQAVLPALGEIDLGVFSLYEIYEFSGLHPVRAEQTLDLAEMDPVDARLLNIDPKLGMLSFQCVTYDVQGGIIEYAHNYTRGDCTTFSVNYHR